MKLAEIGEFGLIERLACLVQEGRDEASPAWRRLIRGIGDDAAAWRAERGVALATTDCLIQDIHFTLDTTSWGDLGWKAMAVNLSDIAASGGRPRYALVTLGLPPDTGVEDAEELYRGMLELASGCGVAIVGGDTSSAAKIFISLTIIGQASKRILSRSAARPGDAIAVTGHLGAAAAGWRLLGQRRPAQEEDAPLRQAFLKPSPRLAEGQMLASEGVKAAIDVSDGLAADLGHICQESRVGAVVEVASLPVHPAARAVFTEEALELALSGGEDYELLFTAGDKTMKRVQAKSACPVTVIGAITAEHPGEVRLIDSQGKPFELKRGGWQHFGSGRV